MLRKVENKQRSKTSRLALKNLAYIFEFVLTELDEFSYDSGKFPEFGGFIELTTFCSCGCQIITEIYSEGIFRCLECGVKRN